MLEDIEQIKKLRDEYVDSVNKLFEDILDKEIFEKFPYIDEVVIDTFAGMACNTGPISKILNNIQLKMKDIIGKDILSDIYLDGFIFFKRKNKHE